MADFTSRIDPSVLYGLMPTPAAQPKRNVFISSFHANRNEVDQFIYRWAKVEKIFTPKALCTFDNDDFINSNDPEYVMREIRRKYLGDASVTIVLIGTCTHSRRYVDWEIKSSLRQGENSLPNGLLAYVLPSATPPAYSPLGLIPWDQRSWPIPPERLAANWDYYQQGNCYARYYVAPDSAAALRQQIEYAFRDRTNRAHLIKNATEMWKNNKQCRVCGVTH